MRTSLRRLPSPGHQAARDLDERERKRLRGGAFPSSQYCEPVGMRLERPLSCGAGKYSPDAEHFYLNATLFGQQVATPGLLQTSSVGTISTAGLPSTTITGSGTAFTSSMIGGSLQVTTPPSLPVQIATVASATSLTVLSSVTIPAGSAYIILFGGGGISPLSSTPATFDQTYDKVLLTRPSDFKMAVVRFSVPISSIPLFYYPIGSCSVGTRCGGIIYPVGVSGTVLQGEQVVVVASADPADDLAVGTPGYPNGAIAVWNAQQFIDAVNNAIYQVTAQMFVDKANNGWLGSDPGGPSIVYTGATPAYSFVTAPPDGTFSPHMAFDPVSNLLSISYEQAAYRSSTTGFIPVWGGVGAVTPATGCANLYFNFPLFQTYFSTFPAFYTQSSVRSTLTTGLDVQLLLKDKTVYNHPVEGPVVPLLPQASSNLVYVGAAPLTITWTNPAVPVGVRPGDIVEISGVATNTAANGVFQVTSVPTAYSFVAVNTTTGPVVGTFSNTAAGGGAAGDMPSYIRVPRWLQLPGQTNVMTQETPTVGAWSSFVSLRLVTSSVPVRPEYVPTSAVNPSGPGQLQSSVFYVQQTTQTQIGATAGSYVLGTANSNGGLTQQQRVSGTSTVNTQSIMIDFLPDAPNVLQLRDIISYSSHEQYRWIDLIGDNPMQRFDVTAQWVDRFGNAITLDVTPADMFDVKFLFQHKYAGTN